MIGNTLRVQRSTLPIHLPRFRPKRASVSEARATFCATLPQQSNPFEHYQRAPRRTVCSAVRGGGDNRELFVGDVIALVTFCLYKQILAIILSPTFPGYLAPLSFSLTRFEEFLGFLITVTATWTICSSICGDYQRSSASGVRNILFHTSRTWLISMPIVAAQLILATAAENGALIGDEGFATHLPLAASGIGEPFVSAAGILGLMTIWRSYYIAFLDWGSFLSIEDDSEEKQKQAKAFIDTVVIVVGICLVGLAGSVASDVGLLPDQLHDTPGELWIFNVLE